MAFSFPFRLFEPRMASRANAHEVVEVESHLGCIGKPLDVVDLLGCLSHIPTRMLSKWIFAERIHPELKTLDMLPPWARSNGSSTSENRITLPSCVILSASVRLRLLMPVAIADARQ